MKAFDNYLKKVDKKQKMMIFASFVIVIGFLLNQFVPPMLERQNQLKDSIETMQLNISKNITAKLKRQLVKNKKKLMSAKEKLDEQKTEIDYIMSNIYKIRYAFFNDMSWVNTLENILDIVLRRV